MVSDIVYRFFVGGDFILGYFRYDSSINHVLELINILRVCLIPKLLTFLSNLTTLGILAIIYKDCRILFERISCLQLPSGFIHRHMLLENNVFIFFLGSKEGSLAATYPALGQLDLTMSAPFNWGYSQSLSLEE